jgi:hypothetical protein
MRIVSREPWHTQMLSLTVLVGIGKQSKFNFLEVNYEKSKVMKSQEVNMIFCNFISIFDTIMVMVIC